MKRKMIIGALALLTTGGIVNAQSFTDVKMGIKAGWNSANITNASSEIDDSKALSTFNAGFVAVVPMGSTFELRTGLDFQSKGTRSVEYEYNPMYIELPVNLTVMLPFNEKVKGYVGAGPYAALGITGKYKDPLTNGDKKSIRWGNDKPGDSGDPEAGSGNFKRFDAGVNAVAGIDFGRVGIHAQYGFGFVNTQPGSSSYWQENKKNQNRVFGVSGVFYF